MDLTQLPILGPALQGMLSLSRSARPIVNYNGADVTQQFYPSLQELSYREGTESKGDSLELNLADPEGLFRQTFSLQAANRISLVLESSNWNYPGEYIHHDCGTFEISRISIRQDKHSGTTVSLTANSISATSNARLERKSRAWTKTNLKTMAQQIAQDNGWQLQYQAKENPNIARTDQHDESDFVLLDRHAHEIDLFTKVKGGKLWVHSKEELERQAPVGVIICPTRDSPGGLNGVGGIISWEITETTEDIYKAAEVKWRNNKTGTTVTGTATDPKAKVGPTLRDKYNPHSEDEEDLDAMF